MKATSKMPKAYDREEEGKERESRARRCVFGRSAWCSGLLGLALSVTFYSTQVLAQPGFVITSPPAGSVVSPGQAVTISWTGGDPSWYVNVYLIDVGAYTVVAAPGLNIPNSGIVVWTFPSSLGFGGPCGHTYEFYVENVQRTSWIYGPLDQLTVVCEIPVAIDIKPGSFPNSINPKSRGTIPVGILSSSTFDAPTSVDRTSLTFGRTGNEQSLAFCNSSPEDVNVDGFLDLVCHFNTQQTGFQAGDTAGALKGKTVTGTPIIGTDSVRIVP